MHLEAIEKGNRFVVKVRKGASVLCISTNEPEGAAQRLKEAAEKSVRVRELVKNPKAALSVLSGVGLKAFWETLFCPVHGVLGKLAAGALIVGAGLITVENWEAASGVLEWALPAALVARGALQVVKMKKVAKAIAQMPHDEIKVEMKQAQNCAHIHSRTHGLFSWKTAFKPLKRETNVTFYKPILQRQAV